MDDFEIKFETIRAEDMAKKEELFEEGLGFFGRVRREINRRWGAPFEQELLALGADGLDHRPILLFVIEFWGSDFKRDAEWRVSGDGDLDPSSTEKVDEAEAARIFSGPPEVGVGGLFEAGGDADINEIRWGFQLPEVVAEFENAEGIEAAIWSGGVKKKGRSILRERGGEDAVAQDSGDAIRQ